MPDTKLSWRSLREHIRKYFWIYLAGIALCLVGSELLWTVTRPRAKNEENVIVFMADRYSNPAPLSDVAEDMLARGRAVDGTLKEVRFESLMYNEDEYTSSMLLLTRLAVGEGDAFLASQAAMDALVKSEVLVPLDDYVARGWLSGYGLEPYYATLEDEETGEKTTLLAGLRIDGVKALVERQAFDCEGAFLCVASNGGNVQTTMAVLETMMEDLADAGTESD